jgi:predicted phosphodiesterase
MKIHPISDLHIDFAPYRPMDPMPLAIDADVVVLAGDLCNGLSGVQWAKKAFANKPVVYVAGNHESYDSVLSDNIAAIRAETAGTNVHFLENSAVVIDGVRFLGATLWSDFEVEGSSWREQAMLAARRGMNDFRVIQGANGKVFSPYEAAEIHRQTVAWLQFMLNQPFDGETVIVTHHGCSPKSIHPRWSKSLLNGAFTSNLEHLLGRSALWIHGHTHDSFDYTRHGTRVIVNPRGYCRSNFNHTKPVGTPLIETCENPAFNPKLVVEI